MFTPLLIEGHCKGSGKDGLRPVTIRYKIARSLTRMAFGCHSEGINLPGIGTTFERDCHVVGK
jgi:hypothetical protein